MGKAGTRQFSYMTIWIWREALWHTHRRQTCYCLSMTCVKLVGLAREEDQDFQPKTGDFWLEPFGLAVVRTAFFLPVNPPSAIGACYNFITIASR